MEQITVTLRCARCKNAATAMVPKLSEAELADWRMGYSPVHLVANFAGAPSQGEFWGQDYKVYLCEDCAIELTAFLKLDLTPRTPASVLGPVSDRCDPPEERNEE